jgi:serine/threonine-protein kinase RsbW
MKQHYLEIDSVRNNIKEVELLMLKVNSEFGLNDDEYNKMMIAVTEIAMNAIIHGNKENADKKVRVFVEYDDKLMRIVITDQGGGFEPERLPDPTDEKNLHDLHGRGVFIAKAMVDEFYYQHHDGKGSEFVMIVHKK